MLAATKLITLILILSLSVPAWSAGKIEETGGKKDPPVVVEEKKAEETKQETIEEKEDKPEVYTCKYYTVTVPDDWKAVLAPVDQQGSISAIFAKKTGTPVVTMLIGQNGGADAQTIAGMFAEQFKASKPPVAQNGQYSFQYAAQDSTAQAYVSVSGKEFMVTSIIGNLKEAKNFINQNVKSEDYSDLLPK